MAETLEDFLKTKIKKCIKNETDSRKKELKNQGLSKEEISELIESQESEIEMVCSKKNSPGNLLALAVESFENDRLKPATHIGTYSHPDVKIGVFHEAGPVANGYLCSGNFRSSLYDYNLVRGAAFIPHAKILEAKMSDGKPVREHWEKRTELFCKTFAGVDVQLENAYCEILKQSKDCGRSDHQIKQIYFPLEDGKYRLFSLLPCSILMWELKQRLQSRQWRQEKKKSKTSNKRVAFFECAQRKFGGTKPQNISFLNSENGGNAYLLTSLPPSLNRKYRLPTRNFFSLIRVYRRKKFSSENSTLVALFDLLHKTMVHDPNTVWSRKKKRGIIGAIIEHGVILKAESIRQNAPPGWSLEENYQKLPEEQKIWLDPGRSRETFEDTFLFDKWPDQIAGQIARFVASTFQRLAKSSDIRQQIVLDDPFINEIKKTARRYLDE